MVAPKPVKWLPMGAGRLAGVGFELCGAVAGGCLLGYWLDLHFKTSPWALVICGTVGIVGGLYNVVRQASRELARTAKREEAEREKRSDKKGVS